MKQILVIAIACTLLLAGCQIDRGPTRPTQHETSPLEDFLSVTGQTILYLFGSITYGLGVLIIAGVSGSHHDDHDVCSTCGYDPCRCGHAKSHHGNDAHKEKKDDKEEKKKERKVAPLLKNKP